MGIPTFAAAAAAVSSNSMIAPLANGLITFFINGRPTFINVLRTLPRNPPDCIILEICVFHKII